MRASGGLWGGEVETSGEAWLCHPQSPVLLEPSSVTCCSVDLGDWLALLPTIYGELNEALLCDL